MLTDVLTCIHAMFRLRAIRAWWRLGGFPNGAFNCTAWSFDYVILKLYARREKMLKEYSRGLEWKQ